MLGSCFLAEAAEGGVALEAAAVVEVVGNVGIGLGLKVLGKSGLNGSCGF